ncbi:uncharacterized protein LOC106473651, partial [Limulus polyphemus]|uniref:Uncharacterized protein LOC106473651 n=1 Tax=Limulus polyphemus TaxID=6850 RepID=A0ABM1TPF9_LIMPO
MLQIRRISRKTLASVKILKYPKCFQTEVKSYFRKRFGYLGFFSDNNNYVDDESYIGLSCTQLVKRETEKSVVHLRHHEKCVEILPCSFMHSFGVTDHYIELIVHTGGIETFCNPCCLSKSVMEVEDDFREQDSGQHRVHFNEESDHFGHDANIIVHPLNNMHINVHLGFLQ